MALACALLCSLGDLDHTPIRVMQPLTHAAGQVEGGTAGWGQTGAGVQLGAGVYAAHGAVAHRGHAGGGFKALAQTAGDAMGLSKIFP